MRIVIALGGNALLRRGQPMTAENQRDNIRVAAECIAAIAPGTRRRDRGGRAHRGARRARGLIGPELTEHALRSIPTETVEVVVTHRNLVGKTLAELVHGVGHGLYLNGLFRAGDQVPATPETVVRKGDVLRVTGDAPHTAALAKAAGAVSRTDVATDIVFLAVGLAIGALVGAITIPVGNVKLSLGTGGGLLLTGLLISVWRTRRPSLGGPFPEPARRLIEDLGLNIFVAIVGLNAGAKFLEAMKGGTVLPLLLGAMFVGLIPPLIVWIVGSYAMKLNPAILLGAMAGARTNSPGMRVAQEDAHSTAPAIGFPVPFAIGTILLTIAGYVLMAVSEFSTRSPVIAADALLELARAVGRLQPRSSGAAAEHRRDHDGGDLRPQRVAARRKR